MTTPKAPVYAVVDIHTENATKKFRNRIGIAYEKENGEISVVLNAFPVNGKLVIGLFSEDYDEEPDNT